jgi:hypothetical protein
VNVSNNGETETPTQWLSYFTQEFIRGLNGIAFVFIDIVDMFVWTPELLVRLIYAVLKISKLLFCSNFE